MQLCAVIGTQVAAHGSDGPEPLGYAGTQPTRSHASSATTCASSQNGAAGPHAQIGASPHPGPPRHDDSASGTQPRYCGW